MIIDAHHHLWDLGLLPYPWLAENLAPRPFGDHSSIKRDYLASDYKNDFRDIQLDASVFVEANSGAKDPAAEVRFAFREMSKSGSQVAIVGNADISSNEAIDQVQRQSEVRGFRGIRVFAGYDHRPSWSQTHNKRLLRSPEIARLCEHLSKKSLSLDLVIFPRQLADAALLANQFDELGIAINHLAMLRPDLSDEEAIWRDGIDAISHHSNVAMKISGLWTIDKTWHPEKIGPPISYALERLGPARLMYGSNMPVEGVMIDTGTQINHLRQVLGGHCAGDVDRIFRRTASEFYRLDRSLVER